MWCTQKKNTQKSKQELSYGSINEQLNFQLIIDSHLQLKFHLEVLLVIRILNKFLEMWFHKLLLEPWIYFYLKNQARSGNHVDVPRHNAAHLNICEG